LYSPNPWKEAKVITLPKPGKDPKFPPNLRPISLLSTTGKFLEKVILKIIQKHIVERGLVNASEFGFRACHNTTLQCMRLTDHVILNFNNKMTTAAVFLNIKKVFDTTWHSGLLYKLSKLECFYQLDQASWLVSFTKKIHSVGRRRNVNGKGCGNLPQGKQTTPACTRKWAIFIPHG
jgi:hypothetical protein